MFNKENFIKEKNIKPIGFEFEIRKKGKKNIK